MSKECGLYQLTTIDDSVRNGRPISIPVSMRWLPYKPASDQYKKGVKGRWQIANAYGWENIAGEPPTHFLIPVDRPVQSSA